MLMNGVQGHVDVARKASLGLSDNDDEAQDDHGGDYSTRFEELMSDGEDGSEGHAPDAEEEEEEFLYSGVDAAPIGGYREQLRDVLGREHGEDDELEEQEVEKSLIHEVQELEHLTSLMADEARASTHSDDTSSAPSTPPLSPIHAISPPKVKSANGTGRSSRMHRPFLHPTVSRLRSVTPQASRLPSSNSMHTHVHDGVSASPSHFSALSRTSSTALEGDNRDRASTRTRSAREVFRWTQLRTIGDYVFVKHSQKASALLGTVNPGSPTVLAANGLICIGTDEGKVIVSDFKQNLRCICGSDVSDRAIGPVTAVALSFDHTYVASGHATGHVQLFELKQPKAPVRFVTPTSLAEVASGRREGHIAGSRIVSIGFVAGRHTAIVSADDAGLSFYHSLGKVLFMDASDTLRLLGKYPDDEGVPNHSAPHHFRRRKSRKASTILAMVPLPLGTAAHPTDQYNLIALLTPIKLVIVGLKPSPKTWYRRHREGDDDMRSKSRFKGTLAWFPSVVPGGGINVELTNKKEQVSSSAPGSSTTPTLVYSWGDTLYLMRVSETKVPQQVRNERTGKVTTVQVGRVTFEEVRQWTTRADILALQWLNVNQVLVLNAHALEVWDIRTPKLIEHAHFDAWSLASPILSHTTNGSVSYSDAVTEVAHSIRVYKGKIFTLGQQEIQVGTLLTWADRILSFVQEGDFLSAIELTRSYYVGETPGNRNGLPESPEKLKEVVGEKMRDLMVASARYAFSEDRMTDSTHVTLDGRGVDRTSLFEGLVQTCIRACMALDDYDFLFEDLFQYYDDNGIARIFLLQLEPFILDAHVHYVPPRITQRIVALHEEDGHLDLAERIIWHIDPDCLDVNQAITLCQKYRLYDALIYVYTRALKDYVSPIVELIALIHRVQQYRKMRDDGSPVENDETIEPVVINAYKIYPYLGNVLSGLAYPTGEPLPEEEGIQARNDVYTFIFSGRSSMWPLSEGGKLILTADEENGVEPTYPYTRLLLRFDPEAFLHTLDLAFEDGYLDNEDIGGMGRLVIVKILLEVLSSPGLSNEETTFGNIFIARNVPKYYQFLKLPPSTLHSLLVSLAEDPDQSTREDRQLAAEYLLSTYTPHEGDRIVALFERAGFYRILRSWYKQEHRWSPLLLVDLHDPALSRTDAFPSINETLTAAKRFSKGVLPRELMNTLANELGSLLDRSVVNTAALLEQHVPDMHERAMQALENRGDEERYAYLRYLLGPSIAAGEDEIIPLPIRKGGPSSHVSSPLRRLYVSLCCRLDPTGVINSLKYLPEGFIDVSEATATCEEHEIYDAVVWILNRADDPLVALTKLDKFESMFSVRIAESVVRPNQTAEDSIGKPLSSLESLGRTAVSMCVTRSKSTSTDFSVEDMWYRLLRSQIDTVQRVAGCCSLESLDSTLANADDSLRLQRNTLSALRSLVQDTFTSLMSIDNTHAISLPRMFKRLLTASSTNGVSKPTQYAEFRSLFTGMLESYRSDSDMLNITGHLVESDLFETMEDFTKERVRGWAPLQGICRTCRKPIVDLKNPSSHDAEAADRVSVVVSRTGALYHSACVPPGQ